ncbi:MAG TPA: sensor histidine kinase KdpD [Gemmataceae bacterium]|nr:sensor histidine kinase KdpD [Gemmataceae bacterium]
MSQADTRPNPDELLARVKAEESRSGRGKLKIFFGYAAGVGKTYAMLEAARREKEEGVDVVVGYVEPHGRPETEALLAGLEALPPKMAPYGGVVLREFDLDAALKRKPRLILIDELAHTNAEGLRHAKRWQDVQELRDAGIDVYATLNVQHLESLNDVIAQITTVVVRETVPDAVLEEADEIELIDLTPEELIDRLKAGKVYLRQQAERALENFFQKSNLQALRELSLRQAAQRLQKDVDAARRDKAVAAPWATNERLLVCVGPSPTSMKLIRTARRMAAAFGAEWIAVAVEQPLAVGHPSATREQISQHLRLAERLGAETRMLIGEKVADTVLDFARQRNVTKIVVGKTALSRWKRLFFGNVVDQLLDKSGEIDVYVIRGEAEGRPRRPVPTQPPAVVWRQYAATAGVVVICGLVGALFHRLRLAEANLLMVFLLGVVVVANRFGRWPAVVCAIANVLVFDFFFVQPYFSFAVSDAEYLFTFAVMLGIGLLISVLTVRIREQLKASQLIEARTAALFRLTKQLGELSGTEFLAQSAGRQLQEIFDAEAVVYLREQDDRLVLRFGDWTSIVAQATNSVVAQWVTDHDQPAGAGTDTLPSATALFVPLIGSQETLGAVGVKPRDPQRFMDPEQRRLLQTCASLIALSIERDLSILKAHEAQLQVQAEQLRNSLLSSVSHDLRTPLAVIAGASSSLLDASPGQTPETRRELLETIVEESRRLTRLVDKLLDMTRLESGKVVLNKQWHVLEEIVGSALNRLRHDLKDHPVRVEIPPEFPLLSIDSELLEQVFFNLLENAARYTPPGSEIEISARPIGAEIEITVADAGPGIPTGSELRIFEKFFRGPAIAPDGRRGAGLGLSICKAIMQAHGGQIRVRNRPEGGAEFTLLLPYVEVAPPVKLDAAPAAGGA